MQIIGIKQTENNFQYRWPDSTIENYPDLVCYEVRSDSGKCEAVVAFTTRKVYGQDRERVTIFIDGYPQAEFFGADDFDFSGEVLSEIKVSGEKGERMCRYPEEAVPERYTIFNTVGLPNRVSGKGIHNAWAVVANIADHKTMISLAALRMEERSR
jgi:hypothetical protein